MSTISRTLRLTIILWVITLYKTFQSISNQHNFQIRNMIVDFKITIKYNAFKLAYQNECPTLNTHHKLIVFYCNYCFLHTYNFRPTQIFFIICPSSFLRDFEKYLFVFYFKIIIFYIYTVMIISCNVYRKQFFNDRIKYRAEYIIIY